MSNGSMMGVELPEALLQAADAKNLVNMATASAGRGRWHKLI
jgi:hypothetical protein